MSNEDWGEYGTDRVSGSGVKVLLSDGRCVYPWRGVVGTVFGVCAERCPSSQLWLSGELVGLG